MLPNIWIFDTYVILITLGVIAALLLFVTFLKKNKVDKSTIDVLALNGVVAILIGIVFAMFFQSFYDFLENPSEGFSIGTRMTFFGGLVGGVLAFLVGYWIFLRKQSNGLFTLVLIIAPACITVAQAFGRIGCFLAGCCYGLETSSWLGVQFPHLPHPVYPTQLFEALFLFALSGCLIGLAFKKNTRTMGIYALAYGGFRFFIEYLRGDERGVFIGGISPSQSWSIVLFGLGAVWLMLPIVKKYWTKRGNQTV